MTQIGRCAALLAMIGTLIALAGCGDDGTAEGADAVEAREGNTVTLSGIDYRVTMFRQLNPRVPPDQALLSPAALPGEKGNAFFAAFLVACNTGSGAATTTSEIHLENAFETTYRPLPRSATADTAYRPTRLAPDRCTPSPDSIGDAALPGSPVVFDVPVDDLSERPFVLEIGDPAGAQVARVELDL